MEKYLLLGKQVDYDNLVRTHDIEEDKLYFCYDTKSLYKGSDLYNDSIRKYYGRPTNPAKYKLYYNLNTETLEYYDGTSWIVIMPKIVGSIQKEYDPVTGNDEIPFTLPTSKAVYDLIDTKIDTYVKAGNVVTKLISDKNNKDGEITVKKGPVNQESISVYGVVTTPEYDPTTRKFTFPIVGKEALVIELGKDTFLDPNKQSGYNKATGNLVLYLNNGQVVQVPVADMIVSYKGVETETVELVVNPVTHGVFANVKVSQNPNNALKVDEYKNPYLSYTLRDKFVWMDTEGNVHWTTYDSLLNKVNHHIMNSYGHISVTDMVPETVYSDTKGNTIFVDTNNVLNFISTCKVQDEEYNDISKTIHHYIGIPGSESDWLSGVYNKHAWVFDDTTLTTVTPTSYNYYNDNGEVLVTPADPADEPERTYWITVTDGVKSATSELLRNESINSYLGMSRYASSIDDDGNLTIENPNQYTPGLLVDLTAYITDTELNLVIHRYDNIISGLRGAINDSNRNLLSAKLDASYAKKKVDEIVPLIGGIGDKVDKTEVAYEKITDITADNYCHKNKIPYINEIGQMQLGGRGIEFTDFETNTNTAISAILDLSAEVSVNYDVATSTMTYEYKGVRLAFNHKILAYESEVNELKDENSALKTRIDTLEQQLNTLRTDLTNFQNALKIEDF